MEGLKINFNTYCCIEFPSKLISKETKRDRNSQIYVRKKTNPELLSDHKRTQSNTINALYTMVITDFPFPFSSLEFRCYNINATIYFK